eukprot:TRINITY_DN2451_c3_g1_i2.p2 TRINITY_DN2451_c3_g1~~TRINITY_DN2451_c3_g1_i2.p2  ORF type:complete len:187 (+),score=4.81 TRINITY_DN2451_c3_g1_i2:228-788(+)
MPDYSSRDLNSFWMNMTTKDNGAIKFTVLLSPSLGLRILRGDKQVIVMRMHSAWYYNTQVQKLEQNEQNTQEAQEFCKCTDTLYSSARFSCKDHQRLRRCDDAFMVRGDCFVATCVRQWKVKQQLSSLLLIDQQLCPHPAPQIAVRRPKVYKMEQLCPLSLTMLIRNPTDLQYFFPVMEAVLLTSS